MSGQRIKAIDPATAPEKTKGLLESLQAQMGMTPNIFRTYANSPAVLEGILALSSALQRGVLPEKLRERIALTVAGSIVQSASSWIFGMMIDSPVAPILPIW